MHHTEVYRDCFDIVNNGATLTFYGILGENGTSKQYIISIANVEKIEIGPKAQPPKVGQTVTITYPQDEESYEG
jgi:hypothetical protein